MATSAKRMCPLYLPLRQTVKKRGGMFPSKRSYVVKFSFFFAFWLVNIVMSHCEWTTCIISLFFFLLKQNFRLWVMDFKKNAFDKMPFFVTKLEICK